MRKIIGADRAPRACGKRRVARRVANLLPCRLRPELPQADAMSDDFFAPPPFDPESALATLRRTLRDLKLAERGNAFEQRGKRVVELAIDGGAIQAKLARRLALTPEWDRFSIQSAAEQRKLVDEVKKRLARWEHDE